MKLYYFDVPARGEAIRMLLRHAQVPFEDVRVTFADWPKLKNTFEGKQLPVLEFEGKRYAQSKAILEFLGAKYGYLPTNHCEIYQNFCIMSTVDDLNEKLFNAFAPYSPYDADTKKKLAEDVVKVDFPVFLPFIEKKLAEKACKDFLVGCHYTIADFYFMGMVAQMSLNPEEKKMWEDFPGVPLLKAYVTKKFQEIAEFGKKPTVKPKLYYFDMPARGEMIRLLLKHAKVDFEDVRIKFPDWPAMKGKFELKQLPVWECCGKQLPQTDAIMHMLSAKHGYLPHCPEGIFKVSFIANTMVDLFSGFVKFFYSKLPEEKKKKIGEDFFGTTVPLIFGILEKRLAENESKEFFVGKQYTMADFYVLGAAKWLILNPQSAKQFEPTLLKTPLFHAYLTKRMADF